jgi:glutathionyl-hydroquinone reductase
MFDGSTGLQQCREKDGFLLLLMVVVSKRLKKLENGIDIAIVHRVPTLDSGSHFRNDCQGTKDDLMFVHQ